MRDPFLIDECLSLDLVAEAHVRGHDATHVVFRGLQGTKDHDLIPTISGGNFVFVTNNGRDFLKLYADKEVHPGLIIIVPGGISSKLQVELFDCALDLVDTRQDLINKVVEVSIDRSVAIRDYPVGGASEKNSKWKIS
jgi:predicted nuclease of predicted toxin-antitoxin system